jgi:hypothetical protein
VTTTREPVFKQRVYAIIFLGIVAWVIYAIVAGAIANWNKTPEQRQSEQRAYATQSAAYSAARERTDYAAKTKRLSDIYMCRVKRACERYGTVRQECATAGDFNNCISVKMGNDADKVGQCVNDGSVALLSTDQMPNAVECFVHGIASSLGAE